MGGNVAEKMYMAKAYGILTTSAAHPLENTWFISEHRKSFDRKTSENGFEIDNTTFTGLQ